MDFKPKYAESFPTLESMYHQEKAAVEEFCRQTGAKCVFADDCLWIENATEKWILHQSLIDGTVILYHQNTKDIPDYQKTFYETFHGYHLQAWYFESILHTLGYIYLHGLCLQQIHIPFAKLPPVMQEFILFAEKFRSRIPKAVKRDNRRLMLKERKRENLKEKADVVRQMLDKYSIENKGGNSNDFNDNTFD